MQCDRACHHMRGMRESGMSTETNNPCMKTQNALWCGAGIKRMCISCLLCNVGKHAADRGARLRSCLRLRLRHLGIRAIGADVIVHESHHFIIVIYESHLEGGVAVAVFGFWVCSHVEQRLHDPL